MLLLMLCFLLIQMFIMPNCQFCSFNIHFISSIVKHFRIMWGLFSKDPSKDFPYESGERLGQIHLANKTVWSLHTGKHRTSGDLVSIFSCDTKDGASQTQLDIAR